MRPLCPLAILFPMNDPKALTALCYDEAGAPKDKPDCRAAIINHLILEEGVDIDEAEDLAEKTLNESGLWGEPETPVV